MRRFLRTIVIGALVVTMSFNPASAWNWFRSGGGGYGGYYSGYGGYGHDDDEQLADARRKKSRALPSPGAAAAEKA